MGTIFFTMLFLAIVIGIIIFVWVIKSIRNNLGLDSDSLSVEENRILEQNTQEIESLKNAVNDLENKARYLETRINHQDNSER